LQARYSWSGQYGWSEKESWEANANERTEAEQIVEPERGGVFLNLIDSKLGCNRRARLT
jgi:hypothetical protein